MAYTTEEDIENYLLTTIDDSFSTQISSWISSAEKWINNYTDRNFEASTSTKKFDGNGKNYLYVDDLISVTSIWMTENDSTSDAGTETLSTTDFYLYQNEDPNDTPYNRILLNSNGDYNIFEQGNQNIWINGSWGYSSSVPEDIKMVATKLVASMIETGKDDQTESFSEGEMSITYRDFQKVINRDLGVKEILNWYKRPTKLQTSKMFRI